MIIWLYFFKQYIKTIFSVLTLFLGLYYLVTYIEDVQHFFNPSTEGQVIFFYYFWQLPDVAMQMIAFVVLISGIIVNWTFSKSGEIAALRSAGMSVRRIVSPLFSIGIIFTLGYFCMNEWVLPYSIKKLFYIKKVQIQKTATENIFITSNWIKSTSGILHFKKFDPIKETLENPEFFKYASSERTFSQIIHGQSGFFDEKQKKWILKNAHIYSFDSGQKNVPFTVKDYKTDINFAPPKILKENVSAKQLNYWQLSKIIDDAKKSGTNISERLVDLYLKTSLPFSCFLFVFLTLPFALTKERQEENYFAILLSVGIGALYLFGTMFFRTLALRNILNPFIAAWGFNLILLFLGSYILFKIDKGR